MIEGMRAVVPDVRIDVEYAACQRWYKKAKPVFDETGTELQLWEPCPTNKKDQRNDDTKPVQSLSYSEVHLHSSAAGKPVVALTMGHASVALVAATRQGAPRRDA